LNREFNRKAAKPLRILCAFAVSALTPNAINRKGAKNAQSMPEGEIYADQFNVALMKVRIERVNN
jgi:hypothetical protein